jgi:hypothetical protein
MNMLSDEDLAMLIDDIECDDPQPLSPTQERDIVIALRELQRRRDQETLKRNS